MAVKFKIKKGDTVTLLAGKDKGKSGDVMKVLKDRGRVLVQGLNTVKKHQKPSMQAAGGIIQKEMSIHISNVAIADPESGKPSRIGIKILENGQKARFAKKSGQVIDK